VVWVDGDDPGDVVLKNLQLKPAALAKLKLPVVVQSGVVGTLRLKARARRRRSRQGSNSYTCLACL
jgi:hypothetical protein